MGTAACARKHTSTPCSFLSLRQKRGALTLMMPFLQDFEPLMLVSKQKEWSCQLLFPRTNQRPRHDDHLWTMNWLLSKILKIDVMRAGAQFSVNLWICFQPHATDWFPLTRQPTQLTQFSEAGAFSPRELCLNLFNEFVLKQGGDGSEATDGFA